MGLPAPLGAYKFPSAMSFNTCFSIDRSATCILFLKILHPTGQIDVQTAILLAPAEVTLVRYPGLPARNPNRLSLRCGNLDLT